MEVGFSKSNFQHLEIEIRVPTFNSRNLVFNIHLAEDGFQLPTTNFWKLEGGNLQSNFHLLRFQVFYTFLPGRSSEAAGHPHALIAPVVPRLQANSLCAGETSLVWGAGPHGSSRVPTGFHGRSPQADFLL